jgi:hypothetical protein
MKNMFKLMGIVAFVVIIGFVFAACDMGGNGGGNGGSDTPSTDGSLTITGLEDYNGKYVIAQVTISDSNSGGSKPDDPAPIAARIEEEQGIVLIAGERFRIDPPTYYGSRIFNGKATLKVWEMIYEDEEDETPEFKSYSGNDQNVKLGVVVLNGTTASGTEDIFASGILNSIDFTNGNGTGEFVYTEPEDEDE